MDQPLISSFFLAARRLGIALSIGGRVKLPQSILRRLFRFVPVDVEIADFDGDLRMRLRLSEHMQRRIFWMGYYSTDIITVLKRVLRREMTVLDVGANIGEITLIAATCVGRGGRVISFEPMMSLAEELEWHVAVNDLRQVMIVREALADGVANDVPIYESCGQQVNDEHHGLGSLYAGPQKRSPSQFISVNTLDDWMAANAIDRVDLLKIDIEGAELPCLRGAEQTLRRFMPAIIVEVQEYSARRAGYHSKDILEFLGALGYEFWRIESAGQLMPLNTCDLLDYQNVLCLSSRDGQSVTP